MDEKVQKCKEKDATNLTNKKVGVVQIPNIKWCDCII
jgi:hypothetical protein